MAERGCRRYRLELLGGQLGPDIGDILDEAQQRWLGTDEIYKLLQNCDQFRISSQTAHLPSSGSLFLFNRKVLRHFRDDGHNWRKKTEPHSLLKVGGRKVLDCYYAYVEENKNFQRRCYWMIEKDLSHIVLVHYQEVKTECRGEPLENEWYQILELANEWDTEEGDTENKSRRLQNLLPELEETEVDKLKNLEALLNEDMDMLT